MTEIEKDNYVVAVYEFRSKQEYIYKTNRVKEIMGASEIITNAFKDIIAAYNSEHGDCINIDIDPNKDFSVDSFIESDYECVVLYEGGGNLNMLFNNSEIFLSFNKFFSWWLIENAPGLTPLCGHGEFSDTELKTFTFEKVADIVFHNSLGEYKRFATPASEANVLPITQIDRKTTLPITKKESSPKEESLSEESKRKLLKFNTIVESDDDTNTSKPHKDVYAQNFDKIIYKKGIESLIAIIYIDGNAMGKRVQNYIGNDLSFEEAVGRHRKFTKEIDVAFVENPIRAIHKIVGDIKDQDKKTTVLAMRRIVGAGDEITIVCNARKALEIVNTYFNCLAETNKKQNQDYSACAGIAVCHSHAPFSDVYEIAEQCCESGKTRIKERIEKGEKAEDSCYIDAYFCQSAITGTLKELRKRQSICRTRMPYCIEGGDNDRDFNNSFNRVGKSLTGLARAGVMTLRDAAFHSQSLFDLELMRIKAGLSDDRNFDVSNEDRDILFDVTTFYDLWFLEDSQYA